jgi:hypothetical protein
VPDLNEDRAAALGESPAGGHGRVPTQRHGDDALTSSKPAPFGSLEMALYLCREGRAGRIAAADALGYVEAELLMFRKITAARDSTVTVPTEGMTTRNPSATSAKAARIVEPRTGSQRARVLADIVANRGSTDYELSGRLKILASSVRPRRLELIQQGYVVDSGKTRAHRGASWTVWTPTAEGRAWYSRQGFTNVPIGEVA